VIRKKTGLVVDAYFSATKVQWILEHVPGARPETLRLTGALTFHGVTRTLEVEVTVVQTDPGTLVIEGARSIDLREFDVPPPSFLLFRVDPLVKVRARLVARRTE